jgi:membrane protease YdiL (CAAX protease family)
LQSAFLHKWPNRSYFFGLPIGRAIIFSNMIFALAHVVSSHSPVRLLTFFPGLIFAYLVYKNKSLLSAILFHAACNLLGQILYASFFLR